MAGLAQPCVLCIIVGVSVANQGGGTFEPSVPFAFSDTS